MKPHSFVLFLPTKMILKVGSGHNLTGTSPGGSFRWFETLSVGRQHQWNGLHLRKRHYESCRDQFQFKTTCWDPWSEQFRVEQKMRPEFQRRVQLLYHCHIRLHSAYLLKWLSGVGVHHQVRWGNLPGRRLQTHQRIRNQSYPSSVGYRSCM